MAKKDVERYYDIITEQYHEMLQDIKEFERDLANNCIDPELVERMKKNIIPIQQNWERWTYMMFLLNQPQRKSKQPKYKERNKHLLKNLKAENSIEATIAENEEARKRIGK